MGVTGGDRCRRCDHYECCGGPQFGCYPSFPEYGDEEAEAMEAEGDEDEDEDDTEPERPGKEMTGMDGRKDGNGAESFWVVKWCVVDGDFHEISGILRNAVHGSKAQAEIKMMAAANNDLRIQRESGGEARMRRFNDGAYDGVVVTGDAFTCDYRLVPVTFG